MLIKLQNACKKTKKTKMQKCKNACKNNSNKKRAEMTKKSMHLIKYKKMHQLARNEKHSVHRINQKMHARIVLIGERKILANGKKKKRKAFRIKKFMQK